MTVGFIGLGRMGGNMCRNIVRTTGQAVLAYDLSAEAVQRCVDVGATAATGLAELAAASDVILSSLPTPRDVETVALGPGGIAENARPGTAYFDLTTSSPELARRVAAELDAKGITMLDAPVSGGPAGAEAGTLAVMVGGDAATLERHLDVLESFSGKVVHVGKIGDGLVAKLVNNLLCNAYVAVACEGLMLAAKAGVDLRRLDEVVRASSGDSFAYRFLADRALSGDYTPAFTLDLAYKDVHLALELADQLGVPAPIGADVHDLMRMARGMGMGDLDPTAMMRVYESTMQHEVRVDHDVEVMAERVAREQAV